MTQQLTSSPRRKLLDEGSFQELLAAAFVLQQHNEHSNGATADPTEILSEIVRIRRSIRAGKLNLVETARLISEQVQKYAQADGVAIGIVADEELIYLAAIGMAAHDIGRRITLDSSLAAHCIRTKVTFRSVRTQDDPRMFSSLGDQTGVKSFIAVPVDYENKVVGALEARFRTPNAFRDDDVRACELLAVLVKEVIARAGQPQPVQEVKLDSDLGDQIALSGKADAIAGTAVTQHPDEPRETPATDSALAPQLFSPPRILPVTEANEIVIAPTIESGADKTTATDKQPCRGCGQHLAQDELFCGKCGTEKIGNPDGPLQSKWASLWFMNEARRTAEKSNDASVQIDEGEHSVWEPQDSAKARDLSLEKPQSMALEAIGSAIEVQDGATTTEAAKSLVRLEWLPDVASSPSESWLRHQWRVNRANFYLAGASLLLIAALSIPALDAGNPSSPQLSLFDRVLVGLGIAEAPDTPVYRGNPDTPVWVDLHTALYYCPGSDLYGKTDGGKIATQRSAQMDQFEPAHRKACN